MNEEEFNSLISTISKNLTSLDQASSSQESELELSKKSLKNSLDVLNENKAWVSSLSAACIAIFLENQHLLNLIIPCLVELDEKDEDCPYFRAVIELAEVMKHDGVDSKCSSLLNKHRWFAELPKKLIQRPELLVQSFRTMFQVLDNLSSKTEQVRFSAKKKAFLPNVYFLDLLNSDAEQFLPKIITLIECSPPFRAHPAVVEPILILLCQGNSSVYDRLLSLEPVYHGFSSSLICSLIMLGDAKWEILKKTFAKLNLREPLEPILETKNLLGHYFLKMLYEFNLAETHLSLLAKESAEALYSEEADSSALVSILLKSIIPHNTELLLETGKQLYWAYHLDVLKRLQEAYMLKSFLKALSILRTDCQELFQDDGVRVILGRFMSRQYGTAIARFTDPNPCEAAQYLLDEIAQNSAEERDSHFVAAMKKKLIIYYFSTQHRNKSIGIAFESRMRALSLPCLEFILAFYDAFAFSDAGLEAEQKAVSSELMHQAIQKMRVEVDFEDQLHICLRLLKNLKIDFELACNEVPEELAAWLRHFLTTTLVGVISPKGSLSESAAKEFFSGANYKLRYIRGLDSLQDAFFNRGVDMIVMPVNHSKTGLLKNTGDRRSYIKHFLEKASIDTDFSIVGERQVPANFSLMVKPGTSKEDIVRIHLNRTGPASCADYLKENSNWEIILHESSSEAAASVNEEGDAALASPDAAPEYGLVILEKEVVVNPAILHFLILSNIPNDILSHTDEHQVEAFVAPANSHEFILELVEQGLSLNQYQLDDGSVFFEVFKKNSLELAQLLEKHNLTQISCISRFPGCPSRQIKQACKLINKESAPVVTSVAETRLSIFSSRASGSSSCCENKF